ncbi:MAG: hypothetical protein ACI9CA_001168 [Natronomonas sp.]|jgi:hypothetical protein
MVPQSGTDSILDCEGCVPRDTFPTAADGRLSVPAATWTLETPVRSSGLRAEVGIQLSTQFNCRRVRLPGQFVRRAEDSYELRTAGERVAQVTLAG